MEKGWISLHRKILDNPILSRGKTYSRFEAFVYLLVHCNHQDNQVLIGNTLLDVKRGSFISSLKKLGHTFKWSSNKTKSFLNLLVEQNMLNMKSTSKYTTFVIIKYDTYQNIEKSKEHQKKIKRISKENQKKIKRIQTIMITMIIM